jgi:hypothetical protein
MTTITMCHYQSKVCQMKFVSEEIMFAMNFVHFIYLFLIYSDDDFDNVATADAALFIIAASIYRM